MDNISCSFCGSSHVQVKHMIEGIGAYICDDCVVQCMEVIEDGKEKRKKTDGKLPTKTPEDIVAFLEQYVIGQERAKKLLAIAVYNHYKRVNKKLDCDVQKSNVILVGPTGSGKTLICSSIAKFLDVPFVQYDCTSLTEAGYVGDDVDQVIARLVLAADGDINRAQRGIVYLDEVDKIARTESNGRDVRGEGVQQSLLKMLEGGVVQVNPKGGKKSPSGDAIDIDTTNILFIVGGAFNALTDKNQFQKKNSLGLGKDEEKPQERKFVNHKDLIKFGMIPEFMGRLPVIAELDQLKNEDLVHILTHPKNALTKQYQALFELDGVELIFEPEFLQAVAEKAVQEGTGARGLRAILEKALSPYMFSVPSKKGKIERIVVSKNAIAHDLSVPIDNILNEQVNAASKHAAPKKD